MCSDYGERSCRSGHRRSFHVGTIRCFSLGHACDIVRQTCRLVWMGAPGTSFDIGNQALCKTSGPCDAVLRGASSRMVDRSVRARSGGIRLMRVVLVHNFYQQAGGEDRVFADEAEMLAANGHEVVKFTKHNYDV